MAHRNSMKEPTMEINLNIIDNIVVVSVIGDIDGKTARDIEQQVLPQIEPESRMVLNLRDVDYISSAGLRMLLSLYRQVKGQTAHIVLAELNQETMNIMKMTGFAKHFTICATVEDGLNALRQEG